MDSCNISQNTEDIKARFNAITRAYHNSKVLDEKPTLSFEEIESKVENWLTDVEVKMISLQPYACEETIERQVAFLKELNSEIKQNFDLLESLNTVYQQTSPTGVVRQGIVEELNDRYQQVSYTGCCCFCSFGIFLLLCCDSHNISHCNIDRCFLFSRFLTTRRHGYLI